ncbi:MULTISPECIES: S-layer homology domain-containing protein [unclassified Paenibacillus]|uniref:S-layer homology domain-containing protein n=1 Tax=unclassified Paenibacillus TaxID=185978 RepID=UPI0024065B06|nr:MULTISPECIES: S-layer homology domain-containing protein [unclassified Paenibacillus]MDF9842461.1 prenyltransferase beta subunit [Paenibacillus sp. PastF-2]MDF9849051.1 prenyltransferase beta subunit [Paenibacillus sp. PastM-2]MDF9855621.1 prenyltransferase beta subunit [Paenibacillus sp. PastF-1]MDH6480893.1 prenyltransferase beta subunit [Paenibacillus sp. PastH-2]MDH6508315.1 prenyltransferase beta subunit [Paenibacillus sp. PastM-3]
MKKKFSARYWRLGLALLLVISIIGGAVVPSGQSYAAADSAVQGAERVTDAMYAADAFSSELPGALEAVAQNGQVTVKEATYKTAEYILAGGVTSEWQAIGLAQAGYTVPDSYVQALEQKVKAAGGSFSSVTDYARIVLAVKAAGADPENYAGTGSAAGYNLIEKIYNNTRISGQTLNAPVYALLALDSGNYTIPGDAKWTKAALLGEILSKQNADGGFTLSTGASDPDMTAMALTALAAHRNEPGVATAGQKAVAWLSAAQDSKGGYGDNSESAAQVIIGLTSFGVDPSGADFTKAEGDLTGRLLSFFTAGGGFAHNEGGNVNAYATEQGLQALVAYNLFSGGSNGKLYDFTKPAAQNPLVYVPLVIEGPQGTLGQGNAYAGNALEALEKVAAQNGLALTNPSGNYVTAIGNVAAGMFGGWDGWSYAVVRGGQWLYPDVGMKDFSLKGSDRIVVYYGGADTQLVESVILSKAQPGEDEAFTVTVNQIRWVWDNVTKTSNPVISKAAGVEVAIGGLTAKTDQDGKAVFSVGLAEGDYTLAVTGYAANQAPAVVKYTQALNVVSQNVSIRLSVEGPEGNITEGTLKAANALAALKKLTALNNIPLQITESSFGSYVSGIAGVANGTYGAYWNFAVYRGGEWIYPAVGMGVYELEESDRVLVYFAGADTQVVNKVTVTPEQPQPDEAFTVKVTQAKWDWNSNSRVESPATGVQVTIDGTTVNTDDKGTASFEKGLSAKVYTLAVTGYVKGAAPKVVRHTQAFKVAPGNVTASLAIEGPQGPLAEGTLDAFNAYDALQQLTAARGIELQATESQYGIFVQGIGGIEGGVYHKDGYWGFAVSRGGKWIYPETGMNDYVLQASDKVLVYYGGGNTQFVESLAVTPTQPKQGEAFTVKVMQIAQVWDANYVPELVVSAAAGVQVSAGGVTATTNSEGIANFGQGLTAGTHTLAVTGYAEGQLPSIARYTQALTVVSPSTVPQPATATISVTGDSLKGTILSSTTVMLNEGETAYSLLVRQLGSKVVSGGSGDSVYIRSIDGLAEMDRGKDSGWMYSVNGSYPKTSAGSYKLSSGDVLAWRYTTDGGADIGNPPGGPGSAGGTGAAGSGSLAGVTITDDNTLPLNQVGQTTAVTGTVMAAAEAAALKQQLAANVVTIEQNVTPGAAASLKDSGGEVELQLPSGAVSGTVKISVRESSSNRTELVSGLYDFKPDGTKFLKTADLLIRIPVTAVNPANLALAWLDESTGNWIPVPASLDLKTGIMTGKVSHFTTYAVVDRSKFEPQQGKLASDITATAKTVAAAEELSDWQAIGLARTGHAVPAGYLTAVKEQLAASSGEFRKVTDYERLVLAVAAAGADPQSIGGYNLIEKIYNNGNMASQGSNGLIFGLIALDSGSYKVPADALWTRERLIAAILELQSKDGGFPLTAGGTDDVDLTAMAVTALSAHTSQAAVQAALDKAVTWLSGQQLENGGYKVSGTENSESTAQIIIALSTAGIGPGDARFVKAKGGLLSHLASFRQADGSYAHTAGQQGNGLATEQALLALSAYSRFLTGDSKLFSITPGAVNGVTFTDESQISAWALASVQEAFNQGLMKGVSETALVFAPKQKITRAEFAALLLRLTGETPADSSAAAVFSDVKAGSWYYGTVLKAKELGIISGVSDTTFNPNGYITRQDMAVMIMRAFKLEGSGASAVFTDESRISSYALSAVRTVSGLGYMSGYNGSFDPAAAVTREMAAVVAVRLP